MNRDLFIAHARLEDRHWWFTGRRIVLRAILQRVAPPGRGIALVDIGCGTGGNIAGFADTYTVLGLDPSPDALEFARQRFPGVTFVQTEDPEAARPHLVHGGVVMMSDVLEHVQDDQALFDRVLAVVPTGGHLLLTVPCDPSLWSPHDVEFGHFRRYTPETFRTLWANAAVDQRLLSPFNARLYPVVAAIRRMHRGKPAVSGGDLTVPSGPMNGLLRSIFAGEAAALVRAIDRGTAPYTRGVSLVALLRKR